jgi:predicted permease
VVAALGGSLARYFYKCDAASSILAMMGACYTNSAFIGIPIIVMAFGQPAPVVIITLFQVILVTTTILTSIEIYQKHGLISLRTLREFPKTVLLNPLIGGSLLGILFALQEWTVPVTLERSFRLLGDAGIPTALFALGLSLGEKRQAVPSSSRTLVYILVVLKTMIHPAIAWTVGRYVFHLGEPWLGALTIIAAMPTAMNNFIFSQRYGVFIAESSQIVFLSSIVSLFTLSGLLWLFAVGH